MTIEELATELAASKAAIEGFAYRNVYGLTATQLIELEVEQARYQIRYNKARAAMDKYISEQSAQHHNINK